jgi:non-heme chloroperoxidase
LPLGVFDGIRTGVAADRSQFFKELTLPFYGYNRPDARISEECESYFGFRG